MKAKYNQSTHSLEEMPEMKEPVWDGYQYLWDHQDKVLDYEGQKTLCKTYPVAGEVKWVDGQILEEGKDFKIGKRSEFYKGNYQNTCAYCKKTFSFTDKLWFICQNCCNELFAYPLIEENKKVEEEKDSQDWISIEDKPLVSFCTGQDDEGITHEMWQVNEGIPDEFLAALQYNDKKKPDKELWWIRHCVIEDERGLCVVTDDDIEVAGWDIKDVTHWMPLLKPPTKINQNK